MIGSNIIFEASLDLNDQDVGHEYTRWPQTQLLVYYREAIQLVGNKLKDWFVKQVIVEVAPGGNWQQVCCDCTKIKRVIGEATEDGRVINYLRKLSDVEENTWAGPVVRCETTNREAYRMESYSINSGDASQFRIDPAVPLGQTHYILVECYRQPSGSLDEDVPDLCAPIVKQWILYRALSVDMENNPAIITLAKLHRDTFFELLNAAIASEALEEQKDGDLRTVQNPPTQRVSA